MSLPEITVIDYGVGNLLSVKRAFERCGAKVILTSDPETILTAKRVVLPGVGSFKNAMETLERLELVSVLQQLAKQQIPLLGICLGMQLLLDESEEFGNTTGLGLISGKVIPVPKFNVEGDSHNIPHIGWNELEMANDESNWSHSILRNNIKGDSVYFVHSYMAVPTNPMDRLADCIYGGHRIAATIIKDQIIGCQFHPEKSGEVGIKMLKSFCEL